MSAVTFVSQVFVELEVSEDGSVSLVLPNKPGDVMEFAFSRSVDGGDYRYMETELEEAEDPAEEEAVAAAWAKAEEAIRTGRCAVVIAPSEAETPTN